MTDDLIEDTLRQTSATGAMLFGLMLLKRGGSVPAGDHPAGGGFGFGDFVATAKKMIELHPDKAAVLLAALAAIDMRSGSSEPPQPPDPRRN